MWLGNASIILGRFVVLGQNKLKFQGTPRSVDLGYRICESNSDDMIC